MIDIVFFCDGFFFYLVLTDRVGYSLLYIMFKGCMYINKKFKHANINVQRWFYR